MIHNKDGAGIQTVEYAGSEAGVAERQQESLYGTLDTEVTETRQRDRTDCGRLDHQHLHGNGP